MSNLEPNVICAKCSGLIYGTIDAMCPKCEHVNNPSSGGEMHKFMDDRRKHLDSYGDGMGIFAGYGEFDEH